MILRRHRNALNIQRLWRGLVVRRYVVIMAAEMRAAGLLIQSTFRSYLSRMETKRLRSRMNRACIEIQRITKGFLARKLVSWMITNNDLIILIQKHIRGYLTRIVGYL